MFYPNLAEHLAQRIVLFNWVHSYKTGAYMYRKGVTPFIKAKARMRSCTAELDI